MERISRRQKTALVIAGLVIAAVFVAVVVWVSKASYDAVSSPQQPAVPASFTAAVPCTLGGQRGLCATVGGTPVILTGSGYRPLTPQEARQVEDSAPTEAAQPQEPAQEPEEQPADEVPQEHAGPEPARPAPVEEEPHVTIADR